MKLFNNILNIAKYSLFLVLFISMLLQTVSISITLFIDNDTELVEIDWEEDADEEEKQENEKRDEKIEPPVLNSDTIQLVYTSLTNYYQLRTSLQDFSMEIPIPPPELNYKNLT